MVITYEDDERLESRLRDNRPADGWTPYYLSALAICAVCLSFATPIRAADTNAPSPAVHQVAIPFSPSDVRLLDGPFKTAQDVDAKYILSLDPDRLLHVFRINAGLPSSAQPLGGWEDPKCELRGHFVGHYLSACAQMYAVTGNAEFKRRADYMVAELAKCQQALGDGYLSAYPTSYFDRLEAGKHFPCLR